MASARREVEVERAQSSNEREAAAHWSLGDTTSLAKVCPT